MGRHHLDFVPQAYFGPKEIISVMNALFSSFGGPFPIIFKHVSPETPVQPPKKLLGHQSVAALILHERNIIPRLSCVWHCRHTWTPLLKIISSWNPGSQPDPAKALLFVPTSSNGFILLPMSPCFSHHLTLRSKMLHFSLHRHLSVQLKYYSSSLLYPQKRLFYIPLSVDGWCWFWASAQLFLSRRKKTV